MPQRYSKSRNASCAPKPVGVVIDIDNEATIRATVLRSTKSATDCLHVKAWAKDRTCDHNCAGLGRVKTSCHYMSSLTTLFTGAGGNGMKASPGTVLGTDTTPAREAFGCNTIPRTPD